MKEYYSKRNGLIQNQLSITFDKLQQYFLQIYRYFKNKEYFCVAEGGVWQYGEQIMEPTLQPSPEVFFSIKLQSQEVWPILTYIEEYDEATLFTVIEILYDHIGYYNFDTRRYEVAEAKKEYSEYINNVLRAYNGGYYLEPTNGFIMRIPNDALREQLQYKGEEMPDDIYEQLSTAAGMFYRFDSNLEQKKKAISILSDILENVREEVKNILNSEYDIGKNEHDKLIFGIVNGFNIRHNRVDQNGDYSREIWYEWMMQYYTSVIITFYKLKIQYSEDT